MTCKPGYAIGDNSCVLIVPGAPCTTDYCPVNGNCVYGPDNVCNIKLEKPCIDGYGYNQGICYSAGTDCIAAGLYGLPPVPNANYTVVPDANNYANKCEFNCDPFYAPNSTQTACTFINQGSCSITNPDPNGIYSYNDKGICVASSCKYGYQQSKLNGECSPIYPNDLDPLFNNYYGINKQFNLFV
jgi:hypothetical protein